MLIDMQFRTITCNGPECKNTVTFEMTQDQKGAIEAAAAHPWVKTVRFVQTQQGKQLVYCSDACELAAVAAGTHNPEERKRIVTAEGPNAAQVAAAQAAAAEAATKSIKAGQGIKLS